MRFAPDHQASSREVVKEDTKQNKTPRTISQSLPTEWTA
jgi:hypothetical protein